MLRIGILSSAKIAVNKVIPAMLKSDQVQAFGLASRSLSKAAEAKEKFALQKIYSDYQSLLQDPDLDAIYNPLPNHMHVDWTLKALQAGKHVLCEKPIGCSVNDAGRLEQAEKDFPQLIIMEAFMFRFHPRWQKAREIIRSGKLGKVKSIHGHFSFFNDDPNNIRNVAEYGGGSLLDIGCYPISVARFLLGREPKRCIGQVEFDPRFKTDESAHALVDFSSEDDACVLNFTCSTLQQYHQLVEVVGTEGKIRISMPFNPQADQKTQIELEMGNQKEEVSIPAADQYLNLLDAFAESIKRGKAEENSLESGINNLRVIDAIFKSQQKGHWIEL
jgi:predicted dehydrogenase